MTTLALDGRRRRPRKTAAPLIDLGVLAAAFGALGAASVRLAHRPGADHTDIDVRVDTAEQAAALAAALGARVPVQHCHDGRCWVETSVTVERKTIWICSTSTAGAP